MNILNIIAVAVPLTIGLGYMMFFLWVNAPLAHKTSGEWVADIWLTSDPEVGTTMYRQRFSSQWAAKLDCKLRAIGLDMILPTSFWVEGDNGQPVRAPYHFGIRQDVRRLTSLERQAFQTVWKTELPNESAFRGRPMNNNPADVLVS